MILQDRPLGAGAVGIEVHAHRATLDVALVDDLRVARSPETDTILTALNLALVDDFCRSGEVVDHDPRSEAFDVTAVLDEGRTRKLLDEDPDLARDLALLLVLDDVARCCSPGLEKHTHATEDGPHVLERTVCIVAVDADRRPLDIHALEDIPGLVDGDIGDAEGVAVDVGALRGHLVSPLNEGAR